MIRNANRNISVAKGHGYTFEKVKFAVDFVNKAGRNTTIEDWVNAYNFIKGTNEDAKGCRACKAAKFTAGVRNYARYGYLTLLNEGYKAEDFMDKPVEVEPEEGAALQGNVVERQGAASSDVERLSSETYTEENKVEEVNTQIEVEQPVVKKKIGRPKKVKNNITK